MRNIVIMIMSMFSSTLFAAGNDDFESYKRQMNAGMQQQKEEYRAYTEKMQKEWNAYLDDIRKNFGSLNLTSDKKWVNYSKDGKSRVAMDNDKGTVTIEFVATDKDKGIKEAKALFKEMSKEINPFSSQPALTENVPLDKVSLEDAKPTGHGSAGGGQVYRLTVPMNEDRQMNNEVHISAAVQDMAVKYGVSYDLVMAIIKTETNFNIGASTRKGALDIRDPSQYENNPWGLMQVVPKRSGREGLKRAKNKNRVPSAEELLDPKTNLEIGVAYLAALQDGYFKGVKNDESREKLMVAGYRDGPEKVFALFSSSGKKDAALAVINQLSTDEVTKILAKKATGPKLPDGKFVANVEKERDNYRVNENERKQFEQEAETIVKRPELLAVVKQWIGTPYLWGGTTKRAVDCSGFTMGVYDEVFRMKLPRTADAQYFKYGGSAVAADSRQQGDLVYFDTMHNGKPVSHVGIWLDNNRFVHASSSKGVIIADITLAYYRQRYVGANRPVGQ